MQTNTQKLVTISLLIALSYVVTVFIRFSIMPAAPFLKYDPKDFIITIGGFIYGPYTALAMSIMVSFLEMLTVSNTGPIGMLMNIISSCSFACTATFIYSKKRSMTGAIAGLLTGCLFTATIMMLWNYFVVPVYTGTPREAVAKLLLPVFLPFNLLKCGINAIITIYLYKPFKKVLGLEKNIRL